MTTIHVYVDPATAIENNVNAGWQPVELDTTTLTEEERGELRGNVKLSNDRLCFDYVMGHLASVVYPPTADELHRRLKARVAARQKPESLIADRR